MKCLTGLPRLWNIKPDCPLNEDVQVQVRDKNAIIFNISADSSVTVTVVPDRQKEFEHIKNINDLIAYFEEGEDEEKESESN